MMLPIAIQVYSVREDAERDFTGTMKQIKNAGYEGVELAGLYGISSKEIKRILDETGLIAISAHVSFDILKNDLEGTIASYKEIGCKYIAIPHIGEDKRYGSEGYQSYINDLRSISRACSLEGIQLLYHNHEFEFQKTETGEYALDVFYREFNEQEMQTELDTCWVEFAGVNAVDYIRQYKNRCPLVHLKNYKMDNEFELTSLGTGKLDVKAIYDAAVECGSKWVIIEQDDHTGHAPMEDMVDSINFIKTLRN